METFASTDNEHILFYDYPFYKKTNKNGSIADINNSDALAQAVKIWLVSKTNEKVRSRGGGVIYSQLGKMMDDERANDMKNLIQKGLKEFNPPLTPLDVTVVPNYEKERWEISIIAVNMDLAIGVNTKVVVINSL